MLERVLRYLRNWFVKEIYSGTFVVEGGSIALPFLRNGQYYRVVGSELNDGVHRYDDGNELVNEEFSGEIWALAIPPELLNTVERIEAWEQKHGGAARSPYTQESFAGYSYQKSGSGNGWENAFRSELSVWRKL